MLPQGWWLSIVQHTAVLGGWEQLLSWWLCSELSCLLCVGCAFTQGSAEEMEEKGLF